jgi:RimJ/RimL family protein N-acetyltransferase
LANDPQLSRNLKSVDYPYYVEDARNWLATLPGEWETGKSAVFAICSKEEQGQLIGTVGIVLDQQNNRGELGYWIGRNYWGQGMATEACRSALDFAFTQVGLNKMVAECLARNPASAAVLEKVGMIQEGFLAKHFRKDETEDYCDVRVFGLLRSTWNGRNSSV